MQLRKCIQSDCCEDELGVIYLLHVCVYLLLKGRELMEHFEQGMGSIEIQGKSGRIERVYFEVKQSRLAQWNEAQIKVCI